MSTRFNWECPYCGRSCTIGDANYSSSTFFFDDNNKFGSIGIYVSSITCPNTNCKEPTISAYLYTATKNAIGNDIINFDKQSLLQWKLRPQSFAKQFPEYVPVSIRNDYQEACLIRDLSPKASATLSRRCLQGIIRDFWKISKSRLIDEIIAIQDKVDPLTFQAIDGVRKIGNIGAHMEKDINQMIDVDPNEASMLIGLVELLIKDWYITKYEREQRLQELVTAAASKKG